MTSRALETARCRHRARVRRASMRWRVGRLGDGPDCCPGQADGRAGRAVGQHGGDDHSDAGVAGAEHDHAVKRASHDSHVDGEPIRCFERVDTGDHDDILGSRATHDNDEHHDSGRVTVPARRERQAGRCYEDHDLDGHLRDGRGLAEDQRLLTVDASRLWRGTGRQDWNQDHQIGR